MHTIFSYDGKIEIDELRERARKGKVSFVILADHAETILERKNIGKVLKEIGNYNSPPFVIFGVEYVCSPRVHLLAVGIKEILENCKDPLDVIGTIHRQGGLAIWGHYDFRLRSADIEILRKMDGIEIWNRKYDGKMSFLPYKGKLFNMIRDKYNKNLKMYNGMDLHSFASWDNLFVIMPDVLSSEEIINNLRAGNFEMVNRYIHLQAGNFSPSFGKYIFMQFTGYFGLLIIVVRNTCYYLWRKSKIRIPLWVREVFKKIP